MVVFTKAFHLLLLLLFQYSKWFFIRRLHAAYYMSRSLLINNILHDNAIAKRYYAYCVQKGSKILQVLCSHGLLCSFNAIVTIHTSGVRRYYRATANNMGKKSFEYDIFSIMFLCVCVLSLLVQLARMEFRSIYTSEI